MVLGWQVFCLLNLPGVLPWVRVAATHGRALEDEGANQSKTFLLVHATPLALNSRAAQKGMVCRMMMCVPSVARNPKTDDHMFSVCITAL